MLRRAKEWLKEREPFRTIAHVRHATMPWSGHARLKSCGEGVRISGDIRISHPRMVVIGNNVVIHRGVTINGGGGLVIGDNVGISYDTTIWTLDHTFHNGRMLPFDEDEVMRPVLIHDNVAIGAHVCITPGVEIGEGAIIGMGSVVSSDVKPLAVMFGNPARVIGFRDREHYDRCKAEGRFLDLSRFVTARRRIVPAYIVNRPALFDIVRSEVESGRAIVETPKENSPRADSAGDVAAATTKS